jgi:hypothetical protein
VIREFQAAYPDLELSLRIEEEQIQEAARINNKYLMCLEKE